MLEIEEREADRARLRVDLTMYLHRLKRDPRVEFPADFARVAGDVYKATKMREELRATGKITLASVGDPPEVDVVPVPVPDPFGDDDAAGGAETAEDETRRKIAEGLARIARLDEKLRARARATRTVASIRITRMRRRRDGARRRSRRDRRVDAKNSRNFDARFAATTRPRWGDPPLETPSAPSRGVFFDSHPKKTPSPNGSSRNSTPRVIPISTWNSPPPRVVPISSIDRRRLERKRHGVIRRVVLPRGRVSRRSTSFGDSRGVRRFARAPGGYFRSASRASSRPASAAASNVSVSVSVSVSVVAASRPGGPSPPPRLRPRARTVVARAWTKRWTVDFDC